MRKNTTELTIEGLMEIELIFLNPKSLHYLYGIFYQLNC
jgi:hypothetical protein